jgi:hypothetical protein
LGNIQYNEDKWLYVVAPIYYKLNNVLKSTRIRDKYIKVRIRYSGEQLAVITAIQSMIRISYS